MPYKAYIDAKMRMPTKGWSASKVKWVIIEALPLRGTYMSKGEAELQANDALRWWKRHNNKGTLRAKYNGFRSRVVRIPFRQ